ncbi:MAG: YqgE/AlgH family protein [Isosphaeraceae bacterium]
MQSLKGQLLIATPQLTTPLFARSVILMLDHGKEGAMGLILNQPTGTMVSALAGKIFEEDFTWEKVIHLGGPVPGSLIVIHNRSELGGDEVVPGVFVNTEASSVQDVIHDRPEPSLVIANYSGWGPGQLEGEFNWDSWITLPASSAHVFWDEDRDLWKTVVSAANARKLSEFLKIRSMPADPSLN